MLRIPGGASVVRENSIRPIFPLTAFACAPPPLTWATLGYKIALISPSLRACARSCQQEFGMLSAMASNRNAVLRGLRIACSNPELLLDLRRENARTPSDSRAFRISLGFMGLGGGAISITRKSTSSPRSYARASARGCRRSSRMLITFFLVVLATITP
jgi:hypothetical protein